jgi:pimeloyl-ACP methyl ester carboxylesterase
MADDTVAYLDGVVGGPAHLVGWSDGAVVALLVAQRRPELVDRQPFLTAASLDLQARICVVAGFWHISWIAGVGMLASGLMAVAVTRSATWT